MDIDSAWDNHAQDLLSRPERFGFDDGRYWNAPVPVWKPKKNVLDLCPIEECVTEGEFANTAKRILDNAHDGFVCLG